MNLLILSTLPHFLALTPLLQNPNSFQYGYTMIITASSTFSILYHINEESKIIATIDYLLAFIWFIYDLRLAQKFWKKIIFLNGVIFLLNIMIPYNKYYVLHSIWHIVSAIKCYYISSLFARTDRVVATALA